MKEIVIKIPEEIYDFVQNTSFVEDENTLFKQSNAERQKTLFLFDIIDAIRTGTPLPKGHERLGDLGKIYVELNEAQIERTPEYKGLGAAKQIVCDAKTIIEADEEGE